MQLNFEDTRIKYYNLYASYGLNKFNDNQQNSAYVAKENQQQREI